MLLGLFALVFPARCVLLPILYWCQGGGRGVAAHPDFRNLFFHLQSPPPQLAPLLASVTIVEMSPEGVSMMWGINGWAVGDNCVVFFVCEPLPCALLGRVCGQGFLLGYLLRSGDMGDFAPCNVLDFQSPFPLAVKPTGIFSWRAPIFLVIRMGPSIAPPECACLMFLPFNVNGRGVLCSLRVEHSSLWNQSNLNKNASSADESSVILRLKYPFKGFVKSKT